MAVYKVIQDIEAEDKLLGPLTFRQFVYAIAAAGMLFLAWFTATRGAVFMAPVFLLPALIAGFFAFPWGRDQPTELWALAKIRFMLKPRKRVWDQSGAKELVTITAPKQVVSLSSTNHLTQDEVRSRLKALATTIDTRGWAIKNVAGPAPGILPESDRLVNPSLLPQPVADDMDIPPNEDMFDEEYSPSARRLDNLINRSTKEHRDKLMASLNNPEQAAPPQQQTQQPGYLWFLDQPQDGSNVPVGSVAFNPQVVPPGTSPDSTTMQQPYDPAEEARIIAELDEQKRQSETAYLSRMHTVLPLSEQRKLAQAASANQARTQQLHPPAQPTPMPPAQLESAVQQPQPAADNPQNQNTTAPVTPSNRTAILQLANNDDLDVATIAREAERSAAKDEVVIKLH